MDIYDCHEMAQRLNVSEIWVRELARKGRIVPAKKAGGRWLFFHNSVVLRPPEHWSYPPRKMKLPHKELSVKQLRKQMEYALQHQDYSKVGNIAGDGDSAWRTACSAAASEWGQTYPPRGISRPLWITLQPWLSQRRNYW